MNKLMKKLADDLQEIFIKMVQINPEEAVGNLEGLKWIYFARAYDFSKELEKDSEK